MELREPGGGEDEGGTSSDKVSQATLLIRLAEKAGVKVFHDDRGAGWVVLPVARHVEILRCGSRNLRHWLARLFWNHEGKAPNTDALGAAVNVLEAQARFDGPEHALHVRVAAHDGAFWYDLVDREWRAIRITDSGWNIVSSPPVLFRRYAHQRPQVEPVAGGDLKRLFQFVNVTDTGDQILLLVYLVSLLVPTIPHPIPVVHGPQGAAKTTLLCNLQAIVDPSITETLGTPRDATELVQQLAHHWVVYYDNLRSLPEWLSDVFCRAVTGQGFTKRELYSDDDDVIYAFRRCVGLNGINIAAQKADLLDRCLLFGLQQIRKRSRKSDEELRKEFEAVVPELLGAALDALVIAMRLRPTVHLNELPRMADFSIWGHAIAQALGFDPAKFHAAIDHNFETRNEEILEASPVAVVVTALMNDRRSWTGTAAELLNLLEGLAPKLKVNIRSKSWPKAPNVLTRRLKEVSSNLSAAGLSVRHGRSGDRRAVVLHRTDDDPDGDEPSPVPSQVPSQPNCCQQTAYGACDDSDDISPTFKGDTPHEAREASEQDLTRQEPGNIVTTVTTVQPKQNQQLTRDDTRDDAHDDDHQTSPAAQAEPRPTSPDHIRVEL